MYPFSNPNHTATMPCLLRLIIVSVALCCTFASYAQSPVYGLLERIDRGASHKFVIETVDCDEDFFELDQQGDKVVVRGNTPVSIAAGINWYLKYYAGIHLSWSSMKASLPDPLPPVSKPERHSSFVEYRYAYNYCTFSYSMAFWDWERWEREIDWLALHGINLPLSVTGAETVWHNVLRRLGYSSAETGEFIAGPGFFAWWLMNNLEGWGGPNRESWYRQQAQLERRILGRMRQFGIKPVLPGYCGMVPNNARQKLGLDVADPGLWCSYRRPAFLQPDSEQFARIASIYYEELERLYGKVDYFSMDPFHEGGNTAGVDLDRAGRAIADAMKRANPDAVWVVQAWQANPRPAMIDNIATGDLLVLDLFSESRPQWGDRESTWYRKNGFGRHNWVYCMLLNYGGNVGLFGKMDKVIDGYYRARADSRASLTLKGVGITPEGIGNNEVMYELVLELPWCEERFSKREWVEAYVKARYGVDDDRLQRAWQLLSNSVYNCPSQNVQQGTNESVFCARPSHRVRQVSSWSEIEEYYCPQDVIDAAALFVGAAPDMEGNHNFEYDLIDVVRQAIAEQGRMVANRLFDSFERGNSNEFEALSEQFLDLLFKQDTLLSTRPEFMVGSWIGSARKLGHNKRQKELLEWNARVLITTWGNREAADQGGLHDYAHREWSGLLSDFYAPRWRLFFDRQLQIMEGLDPDPIDFYAVEQQWTLQTNRYPATGQRDPIETATALFDRVFGNNLSNQ